MSARRYELTEFDWWIIKQLLPNKPREVPRTVWACTVESRQEGKSMLTGIGLASSSYPSTLPK